MAELGKISTHRQVAEKWIEEQPQRVDLVTEEAIISFAQYLDSFKTLSSELQILALQKSMEAYIEFYNIAKARIAPEILQPCIDEFAAKHNHKK